MSNETKGLKASNWSLNLEDPQYVNNVTEILLESVDAVRQTKRGCYVNIVTHGQCGDPRDWLISQLSSQLAELEITIQDIQYIDQCGCGGYVIRVYR